MAGKEIFLIDLDVAKATENALSLKAAIQSIGNKENVEGLVEGLTKVGAIIGGIGAAMFAAKKAFDFTLEAESIRATEKQFELLTAQAGINSEKLAAGLKASTDGLIGEIEALGIANKALVSLGKSAERLPEIMELAKKASAVTGTSVEETFTSLTTAIANGQTRALKAMGIVVDQEAAYKKFAASIGVSNDALSEQGKRQAILNEVLSKGGDQLANVDVGIREAANTWTRFKVTMQEVGETIAIGFDKVAGPAVKGFLSDLGVAADRVKEFFQAEFGEGAAKTKAQIADVKREIGDLNERIGDLKSGKRGIMDALFGGSPDEEIKKAEFELVALEGQLQGLQKQLEVTHDVNTKANTENLVNLEAQRQAQSALAKDIATIHQQIVQAQLQDFTTVEQANLAFEDRKRALEEERKARIAEINAKQINDTMVLQEMLAQTDLLYAERRKQLELQTLADIENAEVTSAERRARTAEGVWAKFAAGVNVAAAKGRKSLLDFSHFGETAATSLGGAFASAFEEVGRGSISLGEAMKKAMVGAIADIAAAKGRELILSSIFPPNPLGLAAGAALMALSGVLRSAVGASAAVPAGGATTGAGAAPEPVRPATEPMESPSVQGEAEKRKAVTIQIQGNYFDTDETRRKLTEMIRQESDATDFKILSVGGRV